MPLGLPWLSSDTSWPKTQSFFNSAGFDSGEVVEVPTADIISANRSRGVGIFLLYLRLLTKSLNPENA